MSTQQPGWRAGGGWQRPVLAAMVTHLLTLGIGGALLVGATFGLAKSYDVLGLLWLGTIGLPTTLGVVGVAAFWGRVPVVSGMAGFCVAAALAGLALQVLVFILAWRWLRSRERAIPAATWRRVGVAGVVLISLATAGLWITQPRLTDPAVVIDGHAHLFGDAGWPPRHNLSCGLSPSQRANVSYLVLTRLLGLPKSGDLDEAYIQALVTQVRETRKVIPRFRVVLLAQDCRYTPQGDPDWVNSTVYIPNEHLFRVVQRYPDWFIPCPSINPQRKDWEAELAYCVAQGARVLKIHPPTQAVDPSEPRFRAFYRKCAQNGVRIMVHTGTEHSAPIASQRLGDPRLLDLALSEGCTVVAAHSATRAFFDPPAEDYFRFLQEMMRGQPRLYGDTAVLGSVPRWRCLPNILSNPVARFRTLYGSDWPFPANALVSWSRLHPLTLLDLMAEKNLFLRDFRLKQALGLPPESFVLASDVLALDRETGRPDEATKLRKEAAKENVMRLTKSAEQGDAEAQVQLGLLCSAGNGVPQSFDAALRWFSKAAAQGNARGQFCLGVLYDRGQGVERQPKVAMEWFRQAAQQDYPPAQFNLGLMLSDGNAMPGDAAEAARWFRKAAEHGMARAQCNLGRCYAEGLGVSRDDVEAVRWYRMAAEQGDPFGQVNLGSRFREGRGARRDEQEAVLWYRKAAAQGMAEGQYQLGLCYYEGCGVERDSSEAFRWFRLAAEQGQVDAQSNLGAMYARGVGVPRNPAAAVQWTRRAADQGDPVACFNLGNYYLEGQGVAQDASEAVKWYRQAADRGDAEAQRNLAVMYHKGQGVQRDDKESLKWATIARRNGLERAEPICSELAANMAPEQVREARALAESFTPRSMAPRQSARYDDEIIPLVPIVEPKPQGPTGLPDDQRTKDRP